MNSIVRKVLLILAIVFGLYTATLYAFMKLVVEPSFSQLQDSSTRAEVSRCRLILKKEMATLGAVCADWSAWDDACQFMADRNQAFVKSALDPAVFETSRLNAAIFIDPSGNVVWSKICDFKTRQDVDIEMFHPDQIRRTPFLYSHTTVDSERTGLIKLGDRLAIVASRPIVSSRMELPVKGAIVMARFIEDEDIRALAESLGTEFVVRLADQLTNRPSPGQQYAINRCCEDHVEAVALMDDVYGNPTFAIVAEVPTPIINKGIWVGRCLSWSVVFLGLVTLAITFILLKRMVLRRIDDLGSALGKVMAKGSGEAVDASSSDELGRHTRMVMQVLERLNSTENALGASDERFHAAFFNAPFPIAIHDETGRIIRANACWTDATGYTVEEMPTAEQWFLKVSPSRASEAIEVLHSLYATDSRAALNDVPIRCKDGTTATWSFCSAAMGRSADGARQYITMAVDVTERNAAVRRLSENESLFRSLTESLPAVTYLAQVTKEAKFIYVSPQTMTFFGMRPADLKASAEPWRVIISPEHYDKVMEQRFIGMASTNQQFASEYPALGRSGETIWLREEAIIVGTEKGPMIQGILLDISDTMHVRNTPAKVARN